jgi:hypothetical protein
VPKLNQLRRETGEVVIPTEGDDPLVITYRKGGLSPELAERLDAADGATPVAQLRILADLVAGAVVAWNLTDDDGAPLPVGSAAISALDSSVLQMIAQAIQEAMRPDPLSGGSSNNGSTARADLEPARIGTHS